MTRLSDAEQRALQDSISMEVFLLSDAFLLREPSTTIVYLGTFHFCTYNRAVRRTHKDFRVKLVLVNCSTTRKDARCISICWAVTPLKLPSFPTSFFFSSSHLCPFWKSDLTPPRSHLTEVGSSFFSPRLSHIASRCGVFGLISIFFLLHASTVTRWRPWPDNEATYLFKYRVSCPFTRRFMHAVELIAGPLSG